MIDLSERPEEILKIQTGDIVLVDGIQCTVDADVDSKRIFLTTVDSDVAKYHEVMSGWRNNVRANGDTQPIMKYHDFIRHLRDSTEVALMSRVEMLKVLKSKTYTIG